MSEGNVEWERSECERSTKFVVQLKQIEANNLLTFVERGEIEKRVMVGRSVKDCWWRYGKLGRR